MAQNVAVIEVDDVGVRGASGSSDLDTASGTFLDTGGKYRLIAMSNGTVTAVPYDAVVPGVPAGITMTVRLTSVSLNWSAAARATSYAIMRGGVQIATTSNLTYRDISITVGGTYVYTIASIDQYKQRSAASAPLTAFIDAALNVAPQQVDIRCWPLPIPTDGPAIIRVNAADADVQNIAYTLGVDAGSLTATADPSVWTLRI